jgi:methylthioribose-1-phosphate isomerase
MSRLRTIEWRGNAVRLVEQTRLPTELVYEDIETIEQMHDAIRRLAVRGAPAIGIAAAYGLYLGVRQLQADTVDEFLAMVDRKAEYLAGARPTAVNLFWALDRMKAFAKAKAEEGMGVEGIEEAMLQEAGEILDEDRRTCRSIGEHGYELLREHSTLLTHCNAGGLATGEYGTALAPVYVGLEKGKAFHVYADETRPLLQGARITAFELMEAGVAVTVICDNMAATVMRQGKIDAVIVGADRIAANGDVANKIGTYGVALLARAHGIPFYVAAPFSTFDLTLSSGNQIPIEERQPDEVTQGFGKPTAPRDVQVFNPAFDVTPAELIAGIITERGVITTPSEKTVREMASASQ